MGFDWRSEFSLDAQLMSRENLVLCWCGVVVLWLLVLWCWCCGCCGCCGADAVVLVD
jgi:hypothetical protein